MDINQCSLCGRIAEDVTRGYDANGLIICRSTLEIPRRSAMTDRVPLVFRPHVMPPGEWRPDMNVSIQGCIRTQRYNDSDGRHLRVMVHVKRMELLEQMHGEGQNLVHITGRLCKKPIYRKTPLGREIADMLLVAERLHKQSDFIPCIAWGPAALYCSRLEGGEPVRIQGRFQSRMYIKRLGDSREEFRTAYEVSVIHVQSGV